MQCTFLIVLKSGLLAVRERSVRMKNLKAPSRFKVGRLHSKTVYALVCGICLFLAAGSARATIIGGVVTGGTAFLAGGVFVKLTPPLPNPFCAPNSVGNDCFQSPNLFGFDEAQNIVLPAPPTIDDPASKLPAGTTLASHYIFFDPGPTQDVIGTVDFDSD